MNNLSGIRIEYGILQSFPVTCLNRDDLNAPKTAIVGGVPRARVSSQCWKRHVRLALSGNGIPTAVRTRLIRDLIIGCLDETDRDNEILAKRAELVASSLVNEKTLAMLTPEEIRLIASYIRENDVEKEIAATSESQNETKASKGKKNGKEKAKKFPVEKIVSYLNENRTGLTLDVALFGRMLAQAPSLDVEGAASFSHAITTHRVDTEVDFFTAIDDALSQEMSGHLGTSQFTSGTYYRYITLDLGILYDHLGSREAVISAVEAFTRALYEAIPSAKQNTMAGKSIWDYAHVFVRKGQPVQLTFEKPVWADDSGYLIPSIKEMENNISRNRELMGSHFGQIGEYIYGDVPEHGIDGLVEFLNQTLGGL